ncbi:MAG: response regulator [Myxococcota bacterium]
MRDKRSSEKRRALIVEDHQPTQILLERFLNNAGIRTDTVANGQEALEYLQRDCPDVVVTDFIMPRMDGLMLARAIRQRPRLISLPIVFLTAVDTVEIRDQTASLGVVSFITKPFLSQNLVEVVSEAINVGRSGRGVRT